MNATVLLAVLREEDRALQSEANAVVPEEPRYQIFELAECLRVQTV
jgi:hypothetical protein